MMFKRNNFLDFFNHFCIFLLCNESHFERNYYKDSVPNQAKLAFLLVTRVDFFYCLIFMSFPLDTHQTKLVITVGETENANICMQLLLALSSFSFLVDLLLLNTLHGTGNRPFHYVGPPRDCE